MAPVLTADDIFAAADALLAEGGSAAVSLRRVRRKLGRGSLQTIHRHLAEWRARRDLDGSWPEPAEMPVRFLPPVDGDWRDGTAILTPHVSIRGDIDVRRGVPEGLLHIPQDGMELVCWKIQTPHAPALVGLDGNPAYDRQRRERVMHWKAKHLGVVIPASAELFVLSAADWMSTEGENYSDSTKRQKECLKYLEGLRRERAQISLQLSRAVYDGLEQAAKRHFKPLSAYITDLLVTATTPSGT